jgi:hypothetical protein
MISESRFRPYRFMSNPANAGLIALACAVFRRDARLLLGDIAPRLVQFDSAHVQIAHKPIVECGAALADTDTKREDSARSGVRRRGR